MNLCDDGHHEVCYDVAGCPVCAKQKELDQAEDEVSDLKSLIEGLNGEIDQLKTELQEANER